MVLLKCWEWGAQCASDQGKFWTFYETLNNSQGEKNSGWAKFRQFEEIRCRNSWDKHKTI